MDKPKPKVAVVTGSNKGIGFAIVRALCKQFDGDVILTSRDEERGRQAVEALTAEKLPRIPKLRKLDINSTESIETLKKYLIDNYGGLDILVNNAAMAYTDDAKEPFKEQAEVSCNTNFWALLNTCSILFPILKPHARVVNMSSFVSWMALKYFTDDKLLKQVTNTKNVKEVEDFMTLFVNDAKAGDHKEKGWPNSAYAMSKVGVSALTIHLQKQFDEGDKKDIIINACNPGHVDTDMSSHQGKLTPDQGADTAVYCALLPENTKSPRGEMVSERKIRDWTKP